jgi:hypothetical protein
MIAASYWLGIRGFGPMTRLRRGGKFEVDAKGRSELRRETDEQPLLGRSSILITSWAEGCVLE